MYKFKKFDWFGKLRGYLEFPNYPVKLETLNKEYIQDKLIEAFAPFLKLEKPLNTNLFNVLFYKYYDDFNMKIEMNDPKIRIQLYQIKDSANEGNKLILEYETRENIRENYDLESMRMIRTRKRTREALESISERETFVENFVEKVRKALARFLNSIILDYYSIIPEVFRFSGAMRDIAVRKGRPTPFIGPAEKRVAQYTGSGFSVVDGFEASSDDLKERMKDPNYFKNLALATPLLLKDQIKNHKDDSNDNNNKKRKLQGGGLRAQETGQLQLQGGLTLSSYYQKLKKSKSKQRKLKSKI